MTTNTFIGVGLSTFANIIQSAGFIAQKKGYNEINIYNKNRTKQDQKSVLTKCIWWLGIIVYTIGGGMDAFAYNFAAQSILAPLDAIKLVTIAILSYFVLKEKISKKDIIAIIIIMIGISIVVSFGPSTDTANSTIDELRKYFKGTPYILTVIILSVITAVDFVGVKFAERKNFMEKNEEITYGRNFLLFSYCWIGCFLNANNTLFIKASVTIIISSMSSISDLKTNTHDFLSYICIIIWISFLILTEYFRQKALCHFGALYVVPLFIVGTIILTVIIGMIFFEEYQDFTIENALLFTFGIIITSCGVWVLSFDIAKLWDHLYDKQIKYAVKEFEKAEFKYPSMIIDGSLIHQQFQQYFYKQPPIFYNPQYDPNKQNNDDKKNKKIGNRTIMSIIDKINIYSLNKGNIDDDDVDDTENDKNDTNCCNLYFSEWKRESLIKILIIKGMIIFILTTILVILQQIINTSRITWDTLLVSIIWSLFTCILLVIYVPNQHKIFPLWWKITISIISIILTGFFIIVFLWFDVFPNIPSDTMPVDLWSILNFIWGLFISWMLPFWWFVLHITTWQIVQTFTVDLGELEGIGNQFVDILLSITAYLIVILVFSWKDIPWITAKRTGKIAIIEKYNISLDDIMMNDNNNNNKKEEINYYKENKKMGNITMIGIIDSINKQNKNENDSDDEETYNNKCNQENHYNPALSLNSTRL